MKRVLRKNIKNREYGLGVVFFVLLIFVVLGLLGWKYFQSVSGVEDTLPYTSRTDSYPTPVVSDIPQSYVIPLKKHMFQSFNNCGPATLSMTLSYLGVDKSQQELGERLRPYQVVGGVNDDKSVTLSEVASQAEIYGFHAYLRPNGTPEKLEEIIALGLPVVTRTWTHTDEDIGHYRVVRGYDKSAQEFIQDDSLQGKDLHYSYHEFLELWKPFNYEYLVIVDDKRQAQVEAILGEDVWEKVAWENALKRVEIEAKEDPSNVHLGFAKSRIYYYLGDYKKSVEEFEKVEDRLSFRTLWYQMEPILAYEKLGDRARVFALTDNILNNQNRAYSEAYLVRGRMLERVGDKSGARGEYEKAVMYNRNLEEAKASLARVSN